MLNFHMPTLKSKLLVLAIVLPLAMLLNTFMYELSDGAFGYTTRGMFTYMIGFAFGYLTPHTPYKTEQ